MVDSTAVEPVKMDEKNEVLSPETAATETRDGDDSKKMNNVLMISSRKARGFYERAAKELFASGDDIVKVSALGDAITLAVELANVLETKAAAKITKVETKYQTLSRQYNKSPSHLPGIQIVLEKNPGFKCSRIIPGYVTHCSPDIGVPTPVYDEKQVLDTFASVNSGDRSLVVGAGAGINRAFGETLLKKEHMLENYEKLHKALLEKAIAKSESNEGGAEKERTMLIEADDVKGTNPDLKASYCRLCTDLNADDKSTGAVFVDVFDDEKRPYDNNNYAMIYVVAPKGSDFKTKELFLEAVQKTAVNLMTTFCDYNGMVKRTKSSSPLGLKRINVIRVSLFSGGEHMHPEATKPLVAEAILSGMSQGYHYGPSPRLNFSHDSGAFKAVWNDMSPPTPSTAAKEVTA